MDEKLYFKAMEPDLSGIVDFDPESVKPASPLTVAELIAQLQQLNPAAQLWTYDEGSLSPLCAAVAARLDRRYPRHRADEPNLEDQFYIVELSEGSPASSHVQHIVIMK